MHRRGHQIDGATTAQTGANVKLTCPACHTDKVQVRRRRTIDTQHWLINCYNGECLELPEVTSKTKAMALKIWTGLANNNKESM